MTLFIIFSFISNTQAFETEAALKISQGVIGEQLKDLQLRNTQGKIVQLSSFLGKPLVISMIYTSCYHICPSTTQHLNTVVQEARNALGEDSFNVITIGFDSFRDSPMMMKNFREAQEVDDKQWQFLSASDDVIETLSENLGFLYETSPHGFDHLIQATLIDRKGKIIQQTYGIKFEMPLLVEPLKKLVYNEAIGTGLFQGLSHKVLLFCTVYDPASNKYRFDYSLFIGMFIGFMSVFLLGITLVKEWKKTNKARRT